MAHKVLVHTPITIPMGKMRVDGPEVDTYVQHHSRYQQLEVSS